MIEHPNRDKASSKVVKLMVVAFLLVSAVLVAVVTVGGWGTLAGAKILQIAYIVLYLVMAFFVPAGIAACCRSRRRLRSSC